MNKLLFKYLYCQTDNRINTSIDYMLFFYAEADPHMGKERGQAFSGEAVFFSICMPSINRR